MNIPNEIQERLKAEGGITAISSLVESAASRIIDGSPGDRFALMQAALPLMEQPSSEFEFPSIDQDLMQRLNEYCESKHLRPDVLLTGALMSELDMTDAGEDSVESDDFKKHCQGPAADLSNG
jgi:hypothetical protein